MEQIDKLRAKLDEARAAHRADRDALSTSHVEAAEGAVLSALGEWWMQGCGDVPPCPRCGTGPVAFLVGNLCLCACGSSAYGSDGVDGTSLKSAVRVLPGVVAALKATAERRLSTAGTGPVVGAAAGTGPVAFLVDGASLVAAPTAAAKAADDLEEQLANEVAARMETEERLEALAQAVEAHAAQRVFEPEHAELRAAAARARTKPAPQPSRGDVVALAERFLAGGAAGTADARGLVPIAADLARMFAEALVEQRPCTCIPGVPDEGGDGPCPCCGAPAGEPCRHPRVRGGSAATSGAHPERDGA